MSKYESVKIKGNLKFITTIKDENNLHNWKCVFRGSWELASWSSASVRGYSSWERDVCRGCFAERFTEVEIYQKRLI